MRKTRTIVAAIFLLCIPIFTACSISSGNFKNTYPELGGKTSYIPPEQIDITKSTYNDILPLSDGWIAVGENYISSHDGVIAKYNIQGEVVWGKLFGGSGFDKFISAIEISDGYIVIANCYSVDGDLQGLKESESGYPNTITVKYDKKGNKIWAKQLPADTAIANKSGFLATYQGTDDSIHIIQFNLKGNIVWTKSIGDKISLYDDTNSREIVKILNGPNGYFLFGKTWNEIGWFTVPRTGPAFIAAISANGTVRWQKQFAMSEIDDVLLVNDGIVVAGSTYKYDGEIVFNGYELGTDKFKNIQKYDFEMNLIWETSYEREGYNSFTDLAEIGENIIVTGFISGFENNTSFVFSIEKNGKIIWDIESHIQEQMDNAYYRNVFRVGEGFAIYQHAYNYGDIGVVKNFFLIYDIEFFECFLLGNNNI